MYFNSMHGRRIHLQKLFQTGKGFRGFGKSRETKGVWVCMRVCVWRMGMRVCGTWEHKYGNTNDGVKGI